MQLLTCMVRDGRWGEPYPPGSLACARDAHSIVRYAHTTSGGAPMSEDLIATLRTSLTGEVFAAGDDGYDVARTVWNGDIDRKPLAVARPVDAAEVAICVRAAT